MHDGPLDLITGYAESLMQLGALKGAIAAVGMAVATIMSGPAAVLVNLLLTLMTFDYLLGFTRAWQLRSINRTKMVRGAVKMLCTPLAVLVVAALDWAMRTVTVAWMPEGVTLTVPLRDLFLLYMCAHEGLSCLEHLGHLGVPIPPALRDRLRAYRDNICPPAPQQQAAKGKR